MDHINVQTDLSDLRKELYGLAVEKTIGEVSSSRFRLKRNSRTSRIKEPRIYEVENEGVIIYQIERSLKVYEARIHFLGFPQDSDTVRNLKVELKKIMEEDEEAIRSRIFPDGN